jgi:hypothetical protein
VRECLFLFLHYKHFKKKSLVFHWVLETTTTHDNYNTTKTHCITNKEKL